MPPTPSGAKVMKNSEPLKDNTTRCRGSAPPTRSDGGGEKALTPTKTMLCQHRSFQNAKDLSTILTP